MNKKQIIQEYLLKKIQKEIDSTCGDLNCYRTFFTRLQESKSATTEHYISQYQELRLLSLNLTIK